MDLDRQLIARAYALHTDRELLDQVKGMISAYEMAVELYNHQWGVHVFYHDEYERALRAFVTHGEALGAPKVKAV